MKVTTDIEKINKVIEELVKDISGIYTDSTECIFSNKNFQIHITATKDTDDFIEKDSEVIDIKE